MTSEQQPIFKAVRLSRVTHGDLRAAMAGLDWNATCHVAATGSLAKALLKKGELAVSIANLLDLFVIGSRRSGDLPSLDDLPVLSRANRAQRHEAILNWAGRISGARVGQSIRIDDTLRQFVREQGGDRALGSLLVTERRDFQRAIRTLIDAGIDPKGEEFKPSTPIGELSRKAWIRVEEAIPELAWPREDLWTGRAAAAVHSRLQAVLYRLFEGRPRWTILHHGFYFYTPPQWALFRLLRESGLANQHFIIHDDGKSQVFETWRRFFSQRLGMPESEPSSGPTSQRHSAQAAAFLAGWEGRFVDAANVGSRLQLVKYRDPAEFVGDLGDEASKRSGEGQKTARLQLYAADHASIKRLCQRLSPASGIGESSLAQLPVGAFLLRLHECIRSEEGAIGTPKVVLEAEAVRDIALSGFLQGFPAEDAIKMRGALGRALPFFADCRLGHEWESRAISLERIIIDQVAPLGVRDSGASDLSRIRTAFGNPLRLVPWTDISLEEAKNVRRMVCSIVETVRQLAARERIELRLHAEFVTKRIRDGMDAMSREARQRLEQRLSGFVGAMQEGTIDVNGLVDTVQILLAGEAVVEEDWSGDDEQVRPLRELDALGLEPANHPIQLANLADGVFPGAVPAIGWPFRREELSQSSISRSILETRAQSAALGDLYLLWLALDGVSGDNRVTLSWLAEVGGDSRNPASVLAMIARSRIPAESLQARIGGIAETSVKLVSTGMTLSAAPTPEPTRPSEAEIGAALKLIPAAVSASALACQRRLALQWLFGQSHGFMAPFQHRMLFGNMIGVLERSLRLTHEMAKQTCESIWRFLSPGERRSSEEKRVVKASRSASPAWVLTLEGKGKGQGPVNLSYQRASSRLPLSGAEIDHATSRFLPLPVHEDEPRGEICKHCPVQDRCLHARKTRDEQI
jgi:hypothetical protein